MIKYSSDIYFSNNTLPGYLPGFPRYLYNEPEYLQLQTKIKPTSFFIIKEKETKILANIHFFLSEEGTAKSPFLSPFGSLEFTQHLDLKILFTFVNYFLEQLKTLHVKSVFIKSFPFAYNEENSVKLFHALLEAGFQINKSELNHHLEVSRSGFKKDLHKMELRKLRKSEEARLEFHQEPAEKLPEIFTFIKQCRIERNQNLSMELEDLEALFHKFSDHYYLFTAKDQENIAAGTIVVKVNDQIWYSFYPASSIQYNHLSPLVFLYQNLLKNLPVGVEIFDLGTSYVNSQPNYGLIKFKERIGGIASLKLTYHKTLNEKI
jgi:hypothetical protein